MLHLESFELFDKRASNRIDVDILMDILSEIKDETNSHFELEQDRYVSGPSCYSTEFNPHLSKKYIDTIQRALQYYYDETGVELASEIMTDKGEIEQITFFKNNNGADNFFKNKKHKNHNAYLLSRKGIIKL